MWADKGRRGFPGQRRKDLHCSRFATPGTTHAAKSRSEGSEEARHHLLRLRTLALAWRCRIAVRVVRSSSGQRVAAPWCLARTTSTMRMCDFTTAGPAESPYERYPLPALPTSWDGMHIHRMLPDLQQEQYQRLYSPRYTAPTSIVRLGSVV